MEIKILIIFLILAISGCEKPMKIAESSEVDISIAHAQFKKSDKKIGMFLDKLDNPKTSQKDRTQIICKYYPAEYKNLYMPALLKLSSKNYTKQQLLENLEIALNYYKTSFGIKCAT